MTGDEFKAWRTMLEMTQQQAGDALGVSRVSIQKWESGEVKISRSVEIACQHVRKTARMYGNHGPVVLYWHDKPMVRTIDAPTRTSMLQMERHPNVDAAVERALHLMTDSSQSRYAFMILDSNSEPLWNFAELHRAYLVKTRPRRRSRAARQAR